MLPLLLSGAAIALLWFALEQFRPLRKRREPLLARLLVNVAFAALAWPIAQLVLLPANRWLLGWTGREAVGLAQVLPLPEAARAVVAFLLMDLTFYWWHRANHEVRFLWRFHNVHHIDPDLDVSTALRFHFGEILLSTGFRAVQIALIGPSLAVYWIFEAVFQANTLFHHSNVRLPIGLERALNLVLVTPRMHGIHHSQVQGETNSNYSTLFPWWDRLHRTLRLNVPQSHIAIGVPGYTLPEDNGLWAAVLHPFRRQRDYWNLPDGTTVERDPGHLGTRTDRLEA